MLWPWLHLEPSGQAGSANLTLQVAADGSLDLGGTIDAGPCLWRGLEVLLEVPDHALDHVELLGIFLAEHRYIRKYKVE